jgi:hypothetical protein
MCPGPSLHFSLYRFRNKPSFELSPTVSLSIILTPSVTMFVTVSRNNCFDYINHLRKKRLHLVADDWQFSLNRCKCFPLCRLIWRPSRWRFS